MEMLKSFWPVLVVILLVVLIVRRLRGEPLDLKDAIVTPVILLVIGGKMIAEFHPTAIDLGWLVGLSAVSLGFGAARSATTVIEERDGQFMQRYRWTTFLLLVGSLVASAVLGAVAQSLGMHEEARPLSFTIGLGLAGEAVITMIRAAKLGAPMPWANASEERRERLREVR